MCKCSRAESGANAQSRKEGENEIVSSRGLGGGNHHGVLSGDNIYDDILLVTDSRQEAANFNHESLMMRVHGTLLLSAEEKLRHYSMGNILSRRASLELKSVNSRDSHTHLC